MAIIGIDLGTTNSLAAAFVNEQSVLIPNQFGEFLTPSIVSLDDEGNAIVGKLAKERLVSHPDRTAAYFKRQMGTMDKIPVGDKTFTPDELSSFVIRQLVHDAEVFLGEKVEEAIISVPAYFDVSQRAATRHAGTLAGITVKRLVNEPSAAALNCRGWAPEDPDGWTLPVEDDEENFIVFDFGGGTLDVSVVETFDNVISISSVSGDNALGGRDFDMIIAKEACRINGITMDALEPLERQSLLRISEEAKRALQDTDESLVKSNSPKLPNALTLSNEMLFKLSGDLFKRMEKPIRQAIYDSDIEGEEISRMILIGGSCHMPIVRQYLTELLAIPVANAGDYDTSVAKGLGLYAGIKARVGAVKDLVLTDICPFSLSTEIDNPNPPYDELAQIIIPRNTTLPTSKMREFMAPRLEKHEALMLRGKRMGMRDIEVGVYQGEGVYAKENKKLAMLHIPVPINTEDDEEFTVTFIYDINAILVVEIYVKSTKQTMRFVYTGNSWATGDKVDSLVQDVKLSLAMDSMHAETQFIIERATRIAAESNEYVRDHIMKMITEFIDLADSNDLHKVMQTCKRFNEILTAIENSKDDNDIFRR